MPRNSATITIKLGLAATKGGLYTVKAGDAAAETKLNYVCPECKTSTVSQTYVCDNGCAPAPGSSKNPSGWTVTELGADRIRVEDKGAKVTFISGADIEAAKAASSNVPKGEMDLLIFPVEEVSSFTWPGGSCYCFEPSEPGKDDFYPVLLAGIARHADKAFVGIINMRGTEKLYRLMVHDGTLRVQELMRPEDVNVFQPVSGKASDPKNEMLFDQLADVLCDEFDPDVFASTQLANLKATIAAATGTPSAAPAPAKPAAAAKPADSTAMLQAMLAAAKAAKAAKAS